MSDFAKILRFVVLLLPIAIAGCDGPMSMTQRLEGEWQGRPETAKERVAREWPRPPGEEEADALELELQGINSQPTDLESQPEFEVGLQLNFDGTATLSLNEEDELKGRWRLLTSEGSRALIEIAVERSEPKGQELRRFEIEFIEETESFTLREEGADKLFGRLLFVRPEGSAAE